MAKSATAHANQSRPTGQARNSQRPARTTGGRQLEEELKGAGHQMDRIDGGSEGLTPKKPTSDDTGKQETEMKGVGKEWPRDHNETPAMCDVDEDGTEHEPQGSHESKHSEADDGIQTKTGHDWPDAPKNSGGSMEEFGNHIKGAEMSGWKGPKGDGVPAAGGDYGGSKSEGWDPDHISSLMEDNVYGPAQLQQLFDLYARDTRQLTLEGFQELLDANGILNEVSEEAFNSLLDANSEFLFHAMQDGYGKYWLSEGLPPELKKHQFGKGGKKGKDEDCDGDDCDEDDDKPDFLKGEGRAARRAITEGGLPAALKQHQFGKGGKKGKVEKECDEPMPPKAKKSMKECSKTCKEWLDRAKGIHDALQADKISEETASRALQISLNMGLTPEDIRESAPQYRQAVAQVARSYGLSIDRGLQRLAEGYYDAQQPGGAPLGGAPDPFAQAPLGELDPGMVDPNDPMAGQDLGGPEATGMGDPALPGVPGELPEDPAFGDLPPEGDMGLGDPGGEFGELPDDGIGLDDPGFDPSPVGDTFGELPSGMRAAMGPGGRPSPFESRNKRRRPLSEEGGLEGGTLKGGVKGAGHQMDHVGEGGAAVEDGSPDSGSGLPQDETEPKELKGKDLLGASQVNTVKPSQAFEGGGKGKLSENLSKLGRYVKQYLSEHDHGLRGQYQLQFRVKLDGKPLATTQLPEVLADAEELALVYGHGRVMLEAIYTAGGKVAHRADVPLPALRRQEPMVLNGQVLFRFQEHAERFAQQLMNEGLSCRLAGHNWGTAVTASAPLRRLTRVFQAVLK